MAQRRYGPTRGPGVAVIEADAGKSLQRAPLGVTAFVGMLEKGDTTKLISCYSARDFKRLCGGRVDYSTLPDACQDFFNHSGGAGELHLCRVTDGTEVKAFINLWSRESLNSPATNKLAVIKVEAKNGGRWGGRTRVMAGEFGGAGNITETTLTTGITMKLNEWAGGKVKLDAVTTKTYTIVSNTTAGVITVTADSTMETDWNSDADEGYTLELERTATKQITLEIGDGEADSTTLWSLRVYVDGDPTLYYPNLSMDPASEYYFLNLINDDSNNHEIVVTDNNGGNTDPKRRPANDYGLISAVTATVLTSKAYQYSYTGTGTYTVALGTLTQTMKYPVKIRCVVLATVTTMDVYATFADGYEVKIGAAETLAAQYAGCPDVPPFTITPTGATEDDEIVINYFPWEPDALIGGYIYPDKINAPNERYRIIDNTVNTLTVSVGDLTTSGAINDSFMVQYPQGLFNGYDGIAGVADADYTATHFDTDLSYLNELVGENKGLVHVATPGAYSATVQKAGINFAEGKNWVFQVEIDPSKLTENDAIEFINSTIGRNDFARTYFPSYGNVDDPDKSGMLKSVPLTGAILGRVAKIAKDYDGYHKAPAGTSVVLSRVVSLDATRLSEEVLTPQGINVVKIQKGNCILWGARTIAIDSAWRFLHHRAMMSHYENTLRETFDWTIFEINDAVMQQKILSTLRDYFLPEWRKRALRGATFDEACSLKVDDDINTAATRAAGELYAEIALQLADTIERFVITISKDGVFEQTA